MVIILLAGLALAARYAPVSNHTQLVAAAGSPYVLALTPMAVLLLLAAHRWTLTVLASVLLVAAAVLYVPLFIGEKAQPGDVAIRVMTANLYLGQADAAALVATADAEADVLVVQELTPAAVQRLNAAGLDKTFPYHVLDARVYASGGGLWSRYPISDSQRISGYQLAMVSARLRIDGVATDPTIVSAHLAGPWPQPIDDWKSDMDKMPSTMRQLLDTAAGGCVIVAGDFNATLDMSPFRRLLDNGFHDAAEQSGAGVTPTYPANLNKVPPVIAIDHVLTAGCTATTARVVPLAGSDHRGLVSTVQASAR
jgi:endonuclease/exonuclease/phosphatase (EEP) superfamily protein YafD